MTRSRLQNLLGIHIDELPNSLRNLGITSLPVKDIPNLLSDPDWNSTVWAFPNDGISISFYAKNGGQFYNDFKVESVLTVGCPMMGYAFYADNDPPLQRSRFPPIEGLGWGSNRTELISLLGEPSGTNATSLIYRFTEENCLMQFDYDNGKLDCSRLQLLQLS